MNTVKKTVCSYDCPTTCGFLVETDGDKILSVCADKDNPASGVSILFSEFTDDS